VVDDAERLIHFLVEVFGAVEQGRTLRPDGSRRIWPAHVA
jgi:hypothetical protein